MLKRRKTLLELHIATFLLGTNSIFVKLLNVSADLILLFRSLIATLTFMLLIKLLKFNLKIPKKDLLIIFFWGIIFALHMLTFFYSVQISNVAISMISLFTFPIMTAILEPIIEKKKIKRKDILLGFAVLLGVLLIVPNFDISNKITLGTAIGLLSAFLYSIRNIFIKEYVAKYTASTVTFYQLTITSVLLLPLFFIYDIRQISSTDWINLLILGTIGTAIAHTLFTKSLEDLGAKSASIITSLQPIYSIILAFFILKEVPGIKTLIGGLIILTVVIYESVQKKEGTDALPSSAINKSS